MAIIGLFYSTLLFADSLNEQTYMKKNTLLITFDNKQNLEEWEVTNDDVMGGLSLGEAQLANKTFIFSGNISTENYGGFTSVFKRLPNLAKGIDAINIRINGDGNRYQLRVRSVVMGYDIAYKIDFETKMGKVENHTFNLADFSASFRGRIITNAPILKATTISHVGFLLATKQPQSFSLSVHAIEFYERVDL